MTDHGYFPRGESMLRHVHEQRAVGLLYGQRALGIGALMPPNFEGTRLHTRSPQQPFRRLVATGKMFETIFFGTRAQADRVLALVASMHQEVRGGLPAAAGRFPAGHPYSALDPELMLWTIAVAAESAMTFFELLVRRATPHERDAFWADYVRFGELFGMPREVAPASWEQFQAWWNGRLASADMHLTAEARRTGMAVMFQIPVPLTSSPAMQVHNLLVLGSLPAVAREHYGLSWSAPQAAAFQALALAARQSRPLVPRALRAGRNTRFFDSVADAEHGLVRRGRPVPGALA